MTDRVSVGPEGDPIPAGSHARQAVGRGAEVGVQPLAADRQQGDGVGPVELELSNRRSASSAALPEPLMGRTGVNRGGPRPRLEGLRGAARQEPGQRPRRQDLAGCLGKPISSSALRSFSADAA